MSSYFMLIAFSFQLFGEVGMMKPSKRNPIEWVLNYGLNQAHVFFIGTFSLSLSLNLNLVNLGGLCFDLKNFSLCGPKLPKHKQ